MVPWMCWRMCGGFQDMGTTAYSFSVLFMWTEHIPPSPPHFASDRTMELPVEVTCHLWWPFEAGIRFAVLFLTDQQTPGGHSVKLSWPEMWYTPCLCNFTKAGVAAYQNINYSSDIQNIQTASAREDPNLRMDQGTPQTNADEHPQMHTELSLQPTLPSWSELFYF